MAEDGSAGGWSTIESDEVKYTETESRTRALITFGRASSLHSLSNWVSKMSSSRSSSHSILILFVL